MRYLIYCHLDKPNITHCWGSGIGVRTNVSDNVYAAHKALSWLMI
jgi:hypothetical protein